MNYVHWQNEMLKKSKNRFSQPSSTYKLYVRTYRCTLNTIAHEVAERKPIYYTWFLAYTHLTDDVNRDRRGRECKREKETTKPNWPDTFFVKAIMVRSWCFCCCFVQYVTRSFFCYNNDLELLLNDLQNRLYMAEEKWWHSAHNTSSFDAEFLYVVLQNF